MGSHGFKPSYHATLLFTQFLINKFLEREKPAFQKQTPLILGFISIKKIIQNLKYIYIFIQFKLILSINDMSLMQLF